MKERFTRRDFLAGSAAAGLGLVTAGGSAAAPFRSTLHKALIDSPSEEALATLKAAGFEGMETPQWSASVREAAEARKRAEKLQMRIHSVLRGWTNFNSPDSGQVAEDIESVRTALRAAEGYGSDAVLLVPCRVRDVAIPDPWEFDIEFDEKTGHVKRVTRGDDSLYGEYIKAQNHATDASRTAVQKLIPMAEKTGVVIALENVWNNLWVKPALFKNFVASFDSPWVQTYFDIGNHVKYAPPQQWIHTLGTLIVKVHVKDFQLNADGRGGSFVDIREGSVDWPAVRTALDDVGYNGWMTIEGSKGLSMKEKSKRLDLIIAGN